MDYHAMQPVLADKRSNRSSSKLDNLARESVDQLDLQENVPPRNWISMATGGQYSKYNGG